MNPKLLDISYNFNLETYFTLYETATLNEQEWLNKLLNEYLTNAVKSNIAIRHHFNKVDTVNLFSEFMQFLSRLEPSKVKNNLFINEIERIFEKIDYKRGDSSFRDLKQLLGDNIVYIPPHFLFSKFSCEDSLKQIGLNDTFQETIPNGFLKANKRHPSVVYKELSFDSSFLLNRLIQLEPLLENKITLVTHFTLTDLNKKQMIQDLKQINKLTKYMFTIHVLGLYPTKWGTDSELYNGKITPINYFTSILDILNAYFIQATSISG